MNSSALQPRRDENDGYGHNCGPDKHEPIFSLRMLRTFTPGSFSAVQRQQSDVQQSNQLLMVGASRYFVSMSAVFTLVRTVSSITKPSLIQCCANNDLVSKCFDRLPTPSLDAIPRPADESDLITTSVMHQPSSFNKFLVKSPITTPFTIATNSLSPLERATVDCVVDHSLKTWPLTWITPLDVLRRVSLQLHDLHPP